jgi:hypothetical protein
MNKKEILIAARALIADREDWCQGALAQDNLGIEVRPESEEAVCWCAIGAFERIRFRERDSSPAYELAWAGMDLFGEPSISDLNDNGHAGIADSLSEDEWRDECHKAVLAAYDKAIADA